MGGARTAFFINGRSLTAGRLIEQFDEAGIDMADYDAVKFISCDSVNLARSFTQSTRLAVTGFRVNLTVQGHTVAA